MEININNTQPIQPIQPIQPNQPTQSNQVDQRTAFLLDIMMNHKSVYDQLLDLKGRVGVLHGVKIVDIFVINPGSSYVKTNYMRETENVVIVKNTNNNTTKITIPEFSDGYKIRIQFPEGGKGAPFLNKKAKADGPKLSDEELERLKNGEIIVQNNGDRNMMMTIKDLLELQSEQT